MKDRITLLIRLQDCDNKIMRINHRKMEGPARIQKIEEELNANVKKFQQESENLDSFKKESRKIEKELLDLEAKIEKSDIKLTLIKSNKEYKAALKEIEDLKKVKFSTEDRAIQIMESIEELEKICAGNKVRQAELMETFEKDNKDIAKELKELDSELVDLEKRREGFLKMVDPELLERYHFIKERKGGQAISSVIGGVCQTCHMNIPPQKFNELLKGNTLLSCPNCYRIIYWGEDEHFQKALEMS